MLETIFKFLFFIICPPLLLVFQQLSLLYIKVLIIQTNSLLYEVLYPLHLIQQHTGPYYTAPFWGPIYMYFLIVSCDIYLRWVLSL